MKKKIIDLEIRRAYSERLSRLMELTDLTTLGLHALTNLSKNYIYSIIEQRRILTNNVADKIGRQLDFDGGIITNLNLSLPENIKNSSSLKKFKLENKNNIDYFISTKTQKSTSYFIESEILEHLKEPKYVWEINELCRKFDRKLTSDKLKKHLGYFVKIGKLKGEKRPIKLRNGQFGTRMVDVFWK